MEPPRGSGESDTLEPSGEHGVVWIVDDSPLEAEMAAQAISAHHEVTVFGDGAMVIERLAEGDALDVLVLDWQLPGMSGIEVCRFLRATLSELELPILMLTVHGHKQDLVDGLAAGANDYLTKPYDAAELLARVKTLVRTRRLHERVKQAEKALEVERDRLLQSESRFRFLARASIALASSLDSAAAATNLAQLAVPEVADWCGLYVREQGVGARPGVGKRSMEEADLPLRVVTMTSPLLPELPGSVAKVVRTGQVAFVPSVAESLREPRRDDGHAEELLAAGVSSWMAVPVAMPGQPCGCLAFARTGAEGVRPFDLADLALAEELGRRTAVAIDNARLFEIAQRERIRVEEANHAKDEFLAMVSHELRTPLNSILGWVVILGNHMLSGEKQARAIATIERNARSQAKLIEDLLDVSRIISGKLRMNMSLIPPISAVEAALETVSPAADAKGVRLLAQLDPGTGPVLADAERLQQIVWNVLSNAVKFTPKGGRVQVRLGRLDAQVEITVSDTGQGISPVFLPHVFERFRQADMGTSRAHGGLGLGLAIVRHLVELHGGFIKASSPGEGQGTTITLLLPVAQGERLDPDCAVEEPALSVAAGVECPAGIAGLRVLLVDDEQDTRELVVSLLERCDVRVVAAASAAEALEAIGRALPDVLVSDVGMPGTTGYDLIRDLRGLPPERGGRIPAVALTAYARAEDRATALTLGFDEHITKPVDLPALLDVIARLARRLPGS